MKQRVRMAAALLLLIMTGLAWGVPGKEAYAAGSLELYTPYREWSAAPGESISYSIDVINRGSATQTADLSFQTNGNSDWKVQLTAGGREIRSLSVKPGDTQTINLQLDVPLKINKGRYTFQLSAAGQGSLPLTVNVSEQGTFKTELTLDQANMEGHSDTTFTYSAVLRNRTTEQQTYALSAQSEGGWDVRFKADGNNVTSVQIEPNAEKTITIEVKPPEQVKAGTYEIPVTASNNTTNAKATVEAVITGTYDMQFSTPDGLLSGEVKAGSERKMDFVVTNTGSAELQDLSFSSAGTPSGWEVSFEPSTINSVPAGEQAHVQATIKASDQSLPGDYVVSLSAQASGKTAKADLRMTVKSSVLWGWIGILIILAVCGGLYYLFRKYGRR